VNAPLQAALAAHWGGNYALALALVASIVAVSDRRPWPRCRTRL